jgi:hypothetical protein
MLLACALVISFACVVDYLAGGDGGAFARGCGGLQDATTYRYSLPCYATFMLLAVIRLVGLKVMRWELDDPLKQPLCNSYRWGLVGDLIATSEGIDAIWVVFCLEMIPHNLGQRTFFGCRRVAGYCRRWSHKLRHR